MRPVWLKQSADAGQGTRVQGRTALLIVSLGAVGGLVALFMPRSPVKPNVSSIPAVVRGIEQDAPPVLAAGRVVDHGSPRSSTSRTGRTLAIHAMGAAGTPLPEVSTWAGEVEAVTDASGLATLSIPTVDGVEVLGRTAAGVWSHVFASAGTDSVRLDFSDEIILAGTVRDRAGGPLSNLVLDVEGLGRDNPGRSVHAKSFDARREQTQITTDLRGHFELRGWKSNGLVIAPRDRLWKFVTYDGIARVTPLPNLDVQLVADRLKFVTVTLASAVPERALPQLATFVPTAPEAMDFSPTLRWTELNVVTFTWPSDCSLNLDVAARGFREKWLTLDAGEVVDDGTIHVLLEPDPTSAPSGDIFVRLGSSPSFFLNRSVVLESRTNSSKSAQLSWMPWEFGFCLPQVAPGEYSIRAKGTMIVSSVVVRNGEGVVVDADLTAFKLVRLAPRWQGAATEGNFEVVITGAGAGMLMKPDQPVIDGVLNLGLFPLGKSIDVMLTRNGEQTLGPKRVIPGTSEDIVPIEVVSVSAK